MLVQARTACTKNRRAALFPTLTWITSGTAVTMSLTDLSGENEYPEREEEMTRLMMGFSGGSARSVSGSRAQIEIDRRRG